MDETYFIIITIIIVVISLLVILTYSRQPREYFSSSMMEEIIKAELLKRLNMTAESLSITVKMADNRKHITIYGDMKTDEPDKKIEIIEKLLRENKEHVAKYEFKHYRGDTATTKFTLAIEMNKDNWYI